MAKKHHMTKHQYKSYEKDHSSRKHDDDGLRESKLSGKIRSRDEGKVKDHLRHLHGSAADLLEDDVDQGVEYEEEEEQMAV